MYSEAIINITIINTEQQKKRCRNMVSYGFVIVNVDMKQRDV